MKSSTSSFILTTLFFLVLFLLGGACQKDTFVPVDEKTVSQKIDSTVHADQCSQLKEFMMALPEYQMPPALPKKEGKPVSELTNGYTCTTQTVEWAPEYNELFLLNPQADIMPGRMYDGNSFANGGYKPIIMLRDSIRLSVSIPTKNGETSYIWVKDPNSPAEIREATNQLLKRTVPGATPAYINFEILRVRSSEEVNKHLATNFKGWGARISGSYDFNSYVRQTKILVRFQQVYYSIDMDPVAEPCAFFNPVPKLEKAKSLFGGTMPVYVASVNYGRAVYYSIESDSSFTKVEKALNASFSKWGMKTGVSLSREDEQTLSNSSIKALIIGGAADGAVKTINGLDALKAFIIEGGDFSADNNLGAPISYRMKFVHDNSDAKLVLAGNYSIRNCELYTEELFLAPAKTARPYDGCPILENGDNEFGSPGVKIKGSITLKVSADKKAVLAAIDILFNEPIDDDNPVDTRARVKETIIAYELTDPKKIISGIESSTLSTIDFTPHTNGNHHPPFTGNFIEDIIIQADGGGDDLPCVGYNENPDGRAFVRIVFNSIKVKARYL